jgi:TolB-like protein
MKKAFFVASFLFLCGLCYSQQTAVAVFPFEAHAGVSQTDAEAITRIFEINLRNTGAIRVVPRNTINQTILNEHDYQMSDFSNSEKTAQWRRGTNADWIVDGIVSRLGRSFLITSRLLDLNSHELMEGARVQIDRIEDAPAMMDAAIEEMARRLTGGAAAPSARPPTDPRYFETRVEDGEVIITGYTGTDTDVVIPQTIGGMPVTGIGWDFEGNSIMSSITIPINIIIGTYVFANCGSLMTITVDQRNASYSSIDGVLFNKNKTRLIKFPPGRTGDYTIPASVITIERGAFMNCNNLTSLTIPASTVNIEEGVVLDSKNFVFYSCANLMTITVDQRNAYYSSLDGVLFNKDKTRLITFPRGKMGTYTIPASVVTIGSDAFWDCDGLTSVTIPANVTNMERNVFRNCVNLIAITVDQRNTYFSSIGSVLFNKDKTRLIEFPRGRTGTYTIPTGVATIGEYAFFNCDGLTSVTIPASVTTIERGAFYGCNLRPDIKADIESRFGSDVFEL